MPAPPLRVLPPPVDLASTLERLHPVVTAWCRRLGGPGVDAQDAAQEVLIITARRAAELHDLGALEPWAFAVTRNVLRRHRRRQWWRRWVGAVDEGLPAPGAGPEDHVGDRRLAGLVDRVLDRLPLEQREVLVLCLAEGRSDSEVAALTGAPAPTVRSRLRLARARFRREVEADPSLASLRPFAMEVPDGGGG